MNQEQINRETQEAGRIRQDILGQIYDGIRGAMADIHRRCIEEPWFGRTIYDVVYERQTGNAWQQGQGKPIDQEPAQEPKAQDATEYENVLESFYDKAQDTRQQDQGFGYGMER